ncbi:PorP/SprF family type IX secretion system membrane protein [Flavobacterium suncheonense]|uniref:Membrane protein n=1 Tax=Flavobacterium suncheonense GH29-5 = DSM 17707 TaxID=1121899 RepID=A0A0A2MD49_9FLAO|nr:type IX secretion system membrane protein PorP/SprF [Flavobacterium suncheonense]KGO89398.1 membrane protein [Flavobacterium suncheonense GH29-5 = DSM 17707]
MKTTLKKITRWVFLSVTLTSSLPVFSQQTAQYTNYMYNTAIINPGYTGTREALSLFGLHRSQWVGFEGAPVTSSFSAHSPLGDSKTGLGFSFVNEQIGPSVINDVAVDFAYRISTGNSTLSFGIRGGASILNVDYNKLDVYDLSDSTFQNNVDNQFSPNIGAGLYWYSNRHYVGVSVPEFLETKHYLSNQTSVTQEHMHYYIMGGYVFNLNENLKLKPALLGKIVSGAPFQLDAAANVMLYDKFTIGGSYRWNAALSALAGFQITEKIFVGYGYDAETTRMSNYNSGSHEIFLRFELFPKETRMDSPRFF